MEQKMYLDLDQTGCVVRPVNRQQLLTTMGREHAPMAIALLWEELHGPSTPAKRSENSARIKRLLEDPQTVWVAIMFGYEVIATARARRDQSTGIAYVRDVVVTERRRRRGLGRLVMRFLEEEIKAQWGDVRIYLASHPTRENEKFYREIGYRPKCSNEGGSIIYQKER